MHAMVAAICPAACRFALISGPGPRRPVLTHYLEFATGEFAGVREAFEAYRTAIGVPLPKVLALALAAPVNGETFVVTQSGWRVSLEELRAAFDFERIEPVNDAAAAGLALGGMDLADAAPLSGATPPMSPLAPGRYGLIHADSGLGACGVAVRANGAVQVVDTEAGHLAFAPQTEIEARLEAQLRRRHGRVSYERLLAWESLGQMHALLAEAEGAPGPPLSSLEVVLRARSADPLCLAAMTTYVGVLGGFAGDIALAMGLDAGIFLCGRFVFEAIDHADWSVFRERFEAKGRLSGLVRALPTWAMTNPASVLAGAALKLTEARAPAKVALAPPPSASPDDLCAEVLGGAACGLLVLDPQLRIVTSNERFWSGASVPEGLRGTGRRIAPAFAAMASAGDWSQDAAAEALSCLQGGKPYSLERSALGGVLLRDEARPTASGQWVITSQDITRAARRARELEGLASQLREARNAADAANLSKSVFLATMSHEIRTPLNGVLGMVQAIAHDELAPAQRERLDVIRQSGEALLAILNDVLDLSKIEAGQLTLESVEFDLSDLVMGAHAAFTALAGKKGVAFTLRIEPGAEGVYLGDPTRLRQILYNVVSNALKFTETGEVQVSAGHRDGELSLTVSDTGIGVAPERLASLFERFVQADASTTRKYGGSGLGLAICRELAEMMGGSIEAQSELGQGTMVTFRAPIARVGEARGLQPAESPPDLGGAPAELRVLAAEDNPVNRLVLVTLLRQLGVEPVCVEDGAQALEAWRAGEWDVILMDVQMPVMDGVEATRRIRALEAELGRSRTPVVALTANVMSHQVADYLAAGMDTHVPKPIQAEALFRAILDMAGTQDLATGNEASAARRA